jgi:hypothetical protein
LFKAVAQLPFIKRRRVIYIKVAVDSVAVNSYVNGYFL